MAWLTLLFIIVEVQSLNCSDQQLPASGDDDLQQVTILQYCLVNNCTIERIDAGEKLDIVYTTKVETEISSMLPTASFGIGIQV